MKKIVILTIAVSCVRSLALADCFDITTGHDVWGNNKKEIYCNRDLPIQSEATCFKIVESHDVYGRNRYSVMCQDEGGRLKSLSSAELSADEADDVLASIFKLQAAALE